MIGRPVPVPDDASAPYWSAAARHVLTVARCSRCATLTLPPDGVCAACGSTEPGFEFIAVDGEGAVRSWTVVRQSFLPGFDVPFLLADVELDAQPGLRLIGRLLDGPDSAIRLGTRVRIAFEDLTATIAVPAFELAM